MKLKPFQRIVMALASVITIFSLVVPGVANAILLDDLTGIMENALEATDDVTSPLLSITPKMIQYYLVSIVCLSASTRTLEWIIANPDWIDLRGAMVTKGWDLTRGLANMFLLLIFLTVAFGFILRIESIEAPRALPRLIIVALLLNFSKLFVGMLVDIATIANNTIIYGHEELLWEVMEGFLNGLYSTFVLMLMSVVKSVLASAIPLAALPKLLISISSLLWKGLFISYMPIWIFQIVAASALTLIFCIYIVLFAARVYIIQILAILSPLAFLCLILPQTQKFWDEWLKHLVQWTFVGTILLFFLMIGLSAGNAILPNANTFPNATTLGNYIPILKIPQYYLFYSFLFIYLAVSFWMVDRTMPLLAVAIVNMSKGVATKGWDKYGKGIKNDLVQRVNEKAVEHQSTQKALDEERITLSDKEKLIHQAKSVALAPVFGMHRLNQSSPQRSVRQYQDKARKRFETQYGADDDGVDRAMEVLNADPSVYRRMGSSEQVGLLDYVTKYKGSDAVQQMHKNGALHGAMEHAALTHSSLVTKAAGFDPTILNRHDPIHGEQNKRIRDLIYKNDSKAKDNFDVMKDVHNDIDASTPEGMETIKDKAVYATVAAKIMEKKDTSDNWNKAALSDKNLQEAIGMKATSNHIKNIGDKHGQAVVDQIHDTHEAQGNKAIYGNEKLARAQASNPAMQEIFPARQDIGSIKNKNDKLDYIDNIMDQERIARGHQPRRTQGGGTTGGGPGGRGGGTGGTDTGGDGTGGGTGGGAGTPPGGAGRRTRNQQPGQTNLGDFGRGRSRQSTWDNFGGTGPAAGGRRGGGNPPGAGGGAAGNQQDLREHADNTDYRAQVLRESDNAPRPNRDAREVDRDSATRGGTTPSGRTSGVYPDDINPPSRRGRGIPPGSA